MNKKIGVVHGGGIGDDKITVIDGDYLDGKGIVTLKVEGYGRATGELKAVDISVSAVDLIVLLNNALMIYER